MPDETAGPPAEAMLLRRARAIRRLSIRDAACRAGISENRWRQIEAGYQTVRKGVRVPATATATTLAHMARAAGIPPYRLETEGKRADAAAILRDIESDEKALVPDEPAGGGSAQARAAAQAVGLLTADDVESVRREKDDVLARNPGATGIEIFPDDEEATIWDLNLLPAEHRIEIIATLRRVRLEEDERGNPGHLSRPLPRRRAG